MEHAHATTKASRKSLYGCNSYIKPAHATTKASRSHCMDAVHIRNLLMLQLRQQEVVAWIRFIYGTCSMLQLKHQEVVAWI